MVPEYKEHTNGTLYSYNDEFETNLYIVYIVGSSVTSNNSSLSQGPSRSNPADLFLFGSPIYGPACTLKKNKLSFEASAIRDASESQVFPALLI